MADRSGRPRKEGAESRYNIRAVERAVAVLNSFTAETPELSLKEITDRTGLSKPTVFRILSTLEPHSYLTLDPSTGRYRLGSRLLELGWVAFGSLALRRVARPHLHQLQSRTGATVLLGTLMDDQLVCVEKRETAGPLRIAADIGWRGNPHFGMLGMVLMAFQEPSEVQRLLRKSPLTRYTRFSIVNREEFLRRLKDIRAKGHGVEFNEAIEGAWAVAAPIWGYDERVIAAVGAALPLAERSEDRTADIVAAVVECARGVSEGMGHRGS